MAVTEQDRSAGWRQRLRSATAPAAPYRDGMRRWIDALGRLFTGLRPYVEPIVGPLTRARRRVGRAIDRRLPKRFFVRALLLIVVPMVLLQSVVTLVFMERHWNAVTEKLSEGTVREIAALIDLMEGEAAVPPQYIETIARDRLRLSVSVLDPGPLPPPAPKPFFTLLDSSLAAAIAQQIDRPFWIDTVNDSDIVRIIVKLEDANVRVFAPRSRAYANNSHIFIVWMVSTALLLIAIAILFLRGQVRPIQQLADAAESFGRGMPMPSDFRPRGATEVRRAGLAFVQMRERIERQIEQRTTMLAGVSHDLRTILTRFRLQLAVATPDELDPQLGEDLRADLDDMKRMLNGYMEFARGEGTDEEVDELSLAETLSRLRADAERQGKELVLDNVQVDTIRVRPLAYTRLLDNLISNALRYAKHRVAVDAAREEQAVFIRVHDDGPGIPEHRCEEALKPFVRLDGDANADASRNQNLSGTGLGLAIARDIARSHGGDLTLGRSDLGGLLAEVRLPL